MNDATGEITRFFTKPWVYGLLRRAATLGAEVLLVSGMGMITSMDLTSSGVKVRLILSASLVPMFSLLWLTEIPSMIESGLALKNHCVNAASSDENGRIMLTNSRIRRYPGHSVSGLGFDEKLDEPLS